MSDQNRNTFVSIRGRDVSLAELHLAFGEKLPEFTQRRWGRSKFVPAGECRDVILALPNGSLPERINAEAKHGTVIVMDWSKQYFFRLLDDGQSRCIVAGNGRKDVGGRAYRRWLGVSEGFEKTDYAFPVLKIRDYFKKEDSSSRHLSPVPRDSASIRDMSNAHGSDESGDDVMDTTARAEVSASRRNTGDLDVSSRMNSRNRRYDISEIIRSDRAHYGTSQPPFTSKRSRDAQPPISASLLDKNGIATKQKLQISTEPYSSLYSYHITTIKGARYIVKLVEGGERGIHYRIWYGHARGFGTDSMALPSQEAGSARKSSVQREDHESDASNASISGNAQQTRNGLHPGRNPTPTSALPPARKPTVSRSQEEILAQMPRKGTQKVPEFRTGRWNQDRWIAQIRHFYGQSRPEFVRDKGNNKPGDKKQVRDSGQYTVQSSRRYSLLTCYEWNSDAVVWVSQIVRRCYIVSSFKVDDRIVWRRWHGPGKGFSTKTVRFEEDSAEANDNSEDSFLEAQTSDSESPNERFQTPPSVISSQARRARPSSSSEEDEEPRPPKTRKRKIDMTCPGTNNANLGAASSERTNLTLSGPVLNQGNDHLEAEIQSPLPQQMQPTLQEQTVDLTNDDIVDQPVTQAQASPSTQQVRIESEDLDEMERQTRQVLINLHEQKLKDILERKARLAKGVNRKARNSNFSAYQSET